MGMLLGLSIVVLFWAIGTFIPSVTVLSTRWGSLKIPALLLIGLLLVAFGLSFFSITTLVTPISNHQPITPHGSNNISSPNLQATLSTVSTDNAAYTTLIHDYTIYHTVLVGEGGLMILLLIGFSLSCWRRLRHTSASNGRSWSFARLAYGFLAGSSTLIALMMLVIVAANLSNAIDPRAGFAHALPDGSQAQQLAIHEAVNTWVHSDNGAMPDVLQQQVSDRVGWQRPKAIICTILLGLTIMVTTKLWQRLIRRSQIHFTPWSLRERWQLGVGVLAVPSIAVLMIMAIANTQAAFAPIVLTLSFG